MVLWSYPPTRKQLTVTVLGLITGASLIAVGAHLSFTKIAPQQARAQARKNYIKARLRQLLDD
ncbi:OLC1v1027568C1 [Oldenlandia corymbosa var. corymbosa]|uniref:OLC1v1027568C1 n=1 Tax=Oldenlandia corymbosa var. corymbosa TaxID=529605 RepID=A0AAV1CR77_OLDCO|nr:OLC1v1027568C1 [Oldenlandia corymbosa var. corymbosa]